MTSRSRAELVTIAPRSKNRRLAWPSLCLVLVWSIAQHAVFGQETLFGCNGGEGTPSNLYRLNPTSGAATLVGAMGLSGCSGLAFDPTTSTLFAVGKHPATELNSLWTVDTENGAATRVGPTNVEGLLTESARVSDLSLRPSDGVLFAFLQPDPYLATLNQATGAAHLVGPTAVDGCCGHAVAFDDTGQLFHADNISLSTLDSTNGTPAVVAALGFPDVFCPGTSTAKGRVGAMDFDHRGVLFGSLNCGRGPTSSPVYLVTIDPRTAVITSLGQTVDGLDGIAFATSARGRAGDANCDRFPTAADFTALIGFLVDGGRAGCGGDDANGDELIDARDVPVLEAIVFGDETAAALAAD